MSEEKKSIASNGSIAFCSFLVLLFTVLKVTGLIDWSWMWVLAPWWIPLSVVIVPVFVVVCAVAVVFVCVCLHERWVDRRARKKKEEVHGKEKDEGATQAGEETAG